MEVFVQRLLAEFILPPFSLGLLGALGLVVARRHFALGMKIISVAISLLFLLSLPIWAVLSSSSAAPKGEAPAIDGAEVIVILGAGRRTNAWEYGSRETLSSGSLERVRYGAWLSKSTKLPLLVSGGNPIVRGARGDSSEAELMALALENEFGIPVTWIESRSNDTRENAEYSSKLLKAEGVERVLLVTHYSHMTRAKFEFEAQGMAVIPAPTVFPVERELSYLDFFPSFRGLAQTRQLIYRRLAAFRI